VVDGASPSAFTFKNTLDDGTGKATFIGDVVVNNNGSYPLTIAASGTQPSGNYIRNGGTGSNSLIVQSSGGGSGGVYINHDNNDSVYLGDGGGSVHTLKNTLDDNKGNMGLGITPTFGLHQLGGSARIQALATPSAPTVANVGTAGTTSYTYYVVATDRNGNKTLAGTAGTTTTGNATLSGSNYNTISWTAVPGAVSYDILKGDTAHSLALAVTGTSLNDTGQATAAYTAPSRNTTADLTIDGVLTITGQPNSAYLPTGMGTTAQNVETTIIYNGGAFANGIYTVPATGVYFFDANYMGNINNGALIMTMYVNNVSKYVVDKYSNLTTSTLDYVLHGTALVGLNAGDTVKFTLTATGTGGSGIYTNNSPCSVIKVS
jgi:hypothetical protein